MRAALSWLIFVNLLSLTQVTLADDDASGGTFERGAAALLAGRHEEAIAELEAHADREAPHPDASYDRGAAYLLRVRSGAERPGDLGRAVAAYEETLLLRPSDAEARRSLELVRAEIARRRARAGKGVVLATPSIDRALVGIVSPRTWSFAAIASGWLLGLGLWLRRRPGSNELAGLLAASVGGVLLLVLSPLAMWADHLDRTRRPAVLVVREAFLTDEAGVTQGGEPVIEGARLELAEARGDRARIRYGAREGWLPAETVRVLRAR
ncbi:MAG: hypothetical protein FJ096_11715 [Deltaproteobacteria bacterium]|nr:hypothetical protein [Deltaproteobacteria bacterium]